MLAKKHSSFILILIFLVSSLSYGQSVLKLKQFDGNPDSYFVAQIRADTTANHGIPADRVYELENGGIYLNTEIFNVAAGNTIRLRAPEGAKAIIYQYPTGTGANPQNPPGNLFVLLGGNLEVTNIAISGIFEYDPANIANVQGGLINTTQVGSSITFDNCILTNINGQHIRTGSATVKVKITNTIFANMGSLTTSNFGAGKGLDLREASCDSLILVNNTFVNYQDRPIRHYNFGNPLAGTGVIGYGLIDHNTFVNGMSFHGLLSLGNVGKKITITNNLFKDAFALGEDSTDAVRSVEWGNTGEKYANDNFTMPWIFSAPNDTTQWTVSNNFYSVSATGQSFFNSHAPAKIGSPLSKHIQSRLGAAAATAFKKVDLALAKTPVLMINLMEYFWGPAGKTKDRPGYNWQVHDMDRKSYDYYENEFDCSYPSTVEAYYGAEKGYPAGDLNWFPSLKSQWEKGIIIGVEDEGIIPSEFTLEQNYPNPFNPTTIIKFSLPAEQNVSLKIFNVLGQEVAELVNQQLKAGSYEYEFNASNLSSGVFFYTLKAGSNTSVKKMLYLK